MTLLRAYWLVVVSLLALPAFGQDQVAGKAFVGMWSDPPPTIEGMMCFGACTDEELKRLDQLMDDPANDAVPLEQLMGRARAETTGKRMAALLTDFSRASYPFDQTKAPWFLKCDPPGFAVQILQPHQFRVTVLKDHIDLHYGEWDVHRTLYMDGRKAPADEPDTKYGFSTAHMEGDTLIVNTSHIKAGILFNMMNHSNQLSAEERYTIAPDADGKKVLTMNVTVTDPIALKGPVSIKKIRYWAPTEVIDPYVDCQIPTDYLQHLGDKK